MCIKTEILVALIGFAGVIATLIFNAWLGRNAQKKQWDYEGKCHRDEQRRERISVRSTLLAELKVAREKECTVLKLYEDAESDTKMKEIQVSTGVPDDTYKSASARIGQLSQPEVDKVTEAYAKLRRRSDKLRLYNPSAPKLDDFVSIHLNDPKRNVAFQQANNLHMTIYDTNEVIKCIDEAVDVLEKAKNADDLITLD